MNSSFRKWLCLIAVAAGHSQLVAQTGLATLTGTITDQSGAVAPGIAVQAVHVDTGSVLTGTTSQTGNYAISQMPIGRYRVTVEAPGFKTFRREGLSLAATQVLRLDVTLEVGAATEAVTVTAEASLLKTENGAVAHNITVSQMQNLPLLPVNGAVGSVAAYGFRDPYGVALLIPGVQYSPSSDMVINGTPNASVNYVLEGQPTQLTGVLARFTQFTQPSADAIQEVAIQTSNFAAEFGTAGGGIFNVTMKSGTNQFHGSAYDYLVNEMLNAAHPYTHLRNRERRQDWGFTFGGPVRIPKLYNGLNKTFFFGSFEQFFHRTLISSTVATVPTEPFRSGDFSSIIPASGLFGQPRPLRVGTGAGAHDYRDPLGATVLAGTVFDPRSTRPVTCNAAITPDSDCPTGSTVLYRTPFPGNRIPASYFDPVGLKVQALVPLPVGPNHLRGQLGDNFQLPWQSARDTNLPSLKVDHNLGAARLSFYWSDSWTDSRFHFPNGAHVGFPNTITAARAALHSSRTGRVNYDHSLTPTTLLHVGVGWTQVNFFDPSPTLDYNPERELGLRGARLNRNFPVFNTGTSATVGGLTTLGPQVQTTAGSERRPSAVLNLTWVRNNHTIKFGGGWGQDMYPVQVWTNTAGNYNFTGDGWSAQSALQPVTLSQGSTGHGYAQFLMGNVRGVTIAVPISYRTSKRQWSLFAQDTWKVTRKFTLDYGLRWDLGTYTREDYGRNGNLSLAQANSSAGGHPGGLIFEATCNCNFASNYPYAIGPRVGFAYSHDTRTVIRGGIGVVYTGTGAFGGSVTNDTSGGTPAFGEGLFVLQDGIPASVNPQWPIFNAAIGHPPNQVVANPAMLDPNGGRPARQVQWSIGVQREIQRDLVVEASYVANRGVWWPAGALSSFNDITPELLSRYGFTVGNAADRGLLTALWRNVNLNPNQLATLRARGVGMPYNGFPTNQTVRQSLRPFPQYSTSINPALAPLGKTWYDALQVTLTKRYSHGLTLNANYTFAKNLSLLSSPDVFNRQLGKNLSATDLPHQFRLSAEYQVPRFRATTPVVGNRTVSYLLSGWGLGVYMQYQSAPLLVRPLHGSQLPISDWLGRGPGSAQLKLGPDGKPVSPYAVNWVDYSGQVHPEPLDINCKCYDPAKTIVLNPAAWASVPNGQWADDLSDIRYYRGIRRPQESANLSRNFRFKEGRMTLQIRVEMNNVFNRMLLPQPFSGGQNFAANPTASGGLYIGGFGTFGNLTGGAAAMGAQRSGLLIGRFQF
jgi:hypothetical protein